MSTWAPAALEALTEEATVDAYGEDEPSSPGSGPAAAGTRPRGLAMDRGIPLLGPLNWRVVRLPS
ncbi:hypothetical protein QQY66_23115 [Streptomyces sp. DG2A-72]|uniref:hypothetical protein n=1 Tax=Streptomyces sp. DG2A-72 TaxID=3051386 RepID=UPI00265BDC53|nr:hypothetical protein [Streptomyces sp. DG2A-72]MDO0934426.1 hypothetical protein [Streptomyces sp. DG2A-72]